MLPLSLFLAAVNHQRIDGAADIGRYGIVDAEDGSFIYVDAAHQVIDVWVFDAELRQSHGHAYRLVEPPETAYALEGVGGVIATLWNTENTVRHLRHLGGTVCGHELHPCRVDDGQFGFCPTPYVKPKSQKLKRSAHGSLSANEESFYLVIRIDKEEGVDWREQMHKEVLELLE